jgi:hypothetical protein
MFTPSSIVVLLVARDRCYEALASNVRKRLLPTRQISIVSPCLVVLAVNAAKRRILQNMRKQADEAIADDAQHSDK